MARLLSRIQVNFGQWVDPPADYMQKRLERMKQELEAMRLHLAADDQEN